MPRPLSAVTSTASIILSGDTHRWTSSVPLPTKGRRPDPKSSLHFYGASPTHRLTGLPAIPDFSPLDRRVVDTTSLFHHPRSTSDQRLTCCVHRLSVLLIP